MTTTGFDQVRSEYSVSSLAALSGVSIRTLRYYDRIGLLRPASRTASGYRVYGRRELQRLQLILFYRELELPLAKIRALLGGSGSGPGTLGTLSEQRRILEAKRDRLEALMRTIDRTIAQEKGETMLSDSELYEGFSAEKVGAMKKEAEARWGKTEAYRESQKRVGSMTREGFAAVKANGEAIEGDLAELFRRGAAVTSQEALAIAARWESHLRSFYEPSPEMLAGLGDLYVDSPEFRARYEAMEPGLPEFFRDLLHAYAGRSRGI